MTKKVGIEYLKALSCMGILIAHSAAYAEMIFPGMELASSLDYPGRYGMLSYVAFF